MKNDIINKSKNRIKSIRKPFDNKVTYSWRLLNKTSMERGTKYEKEKEL